MLGYMKKGGKRKTDADEGNTLNNSLLDDEYSSQTELAENPVLDAVGFAESVSPSQPSHISKKQTTEFEAKRKKQWQKEGYRWDFCLVLPNPEDDSFKKEEFSDEYKAPNEIIERLHLAGLETHQFLSGDADEIFIKIRAPLKILREHAANVEYNLLMDSAYLKRHVENKNEPIGSDPAHTLLSPYECLYTKYDDSKRALFAKADGLRHPFSSVLRIKLIYDIITNDEDDCCSLNLRRLKVDGSGSIIAYFPLHDDGPREQLARNWFGWSVRPWEQPLDDVKEYVGEKITLYFAFTGHYTTWLTSLCAVSLVVILYFFVLLVMEGNLVMALSKGFMIPFFCIFVAIWAQLMLEYWKQTQNVKAMEWGQTEFEEEEDERPEFEQTKMVPSLISGQQSKYFSPVIRGERQMWSLFVVCCMVMMVLLVVSMIFYLQYLVNNDFTGTLLTLGNGLVSVLQAVSIVVLNTFYSNMAVDLNNNENHRTDTEYDDSLIGKLYVFQFVNSYAALFFIAFVKVQLGLECQGPCMVELAMSLIIIFASQLTISKVSAYLEIVVNTKLKERDNEQQRQDRLAAGKDVYPMTAAEKENQLQDYDPSIDVISDYATIVMQYGYVTLFVASCPLAPLLAYASNFMELRLDGYKLLFLTKRPLPVGAEDIGTWLDIMQLTSIAAVITNAALVIYTMDLSKDLTPYGRLWIFIGFQYTIFVIMALFAWLVDDMPEYVQIQLDRQKYMAERAAKSEAELEALDNKTPAISRPMQTNIPEDVFTIHRTDGYDDEMGW